MGRKNKESALKNVPTPPSKKPLIFTIILLILVIVIAVSCFPKKADAQTTGDITVVFRPVEPSNLRSTGTLLLTVADPRLAQELDSAIVVTYEQFESTHPLNWGQKPGDSGPGMQATIIVDEELKEIYFLTATTLKFDLSDAFPWNENRENSITREWRLMLPSLSKTVSN